ncbi:MAG: helix-hairpin-helix domain-containing protein [Elusimicrobia bacterium]|nr:helix-hairpin-helix domain-containing protein [Elusimicrobiota bacterium]
MPKKTRRFSAAGGCALFLVVAVGGQAAFEEKPFSARAAGLGEAMTALQEGTDFFYNPAQLRTLRQGELVSGYTRLFSLPDLAQSSLACAFPTRSRGSWGMSARQFGNSMYREQEFSIAHSVFLSSPVALGYSFRLYRLSLSRYGSVSALGMDVGVLGRFHPKVSAGVSFQNVNQPNFSNTTEGPPQQMRFGLAFRPVPMSQTSFDLVRPVAGRVSLRAGQEMRGSSFLSVRFGAQTEPNRFSVGVGLNARGILLDYAYLTHPFLEGQHHVDLVFRWGKEPSPRPAEGDKTVDLNKAAFDELMRLPGVGRATAEKILRFREENGPFQKTEDLLRVPGMSRRAFLKIHPFMEIATDDSPLKTR